MRKGGQKNPRQVGEVALKLCDQKSEEPRLG